MLDEFRQATAGDLDAAWGLYAASCSAQTPEDPGPGWTLGVYPSRDDLVRAIGDGDLFLGAVAGRVAGATVVSTGDDDDYASVAWAHPVPRGDVAVLHLLAVDPGLRGRGIGGELLERALDVARGRGLLAVHLDVTLPNAGARRLYESHGFEFAGAHELYYEDTGRQRFLMFERLL